MTTRLIALPDLSAGELGAWTELAGRCAEPNPFYEPEFVLPTVERAGGGGAQLLVVERDGEWLACVPVRLRGAPPFGALRSWCDEYCFLGTPLVARDAVRESIEALLGAAAERHRLMIFERLALDGPIAAVVTELLETHRYRLVLERRSARACAIRPAEPPEPSAKERRERRRQLRRLQDDLGTEVEVRDRSDDPAAIEDFLRLEAASWKGREGTALASRPADAAFMTAIADAYRALGRLEVRELSATVGEPLAIGCHLVAGDSVFWFKTAFDESLRRHSPGVALMFDSRDRFYESDARLLDSCSAPDSLAVNRILPDRRELATLIIGPAGARTALARGAAKAAAAVHARRRGLQSARARVRRREAPHA